jgi:hypothetical protein
MPRHEIRDLHTAVMDSREPPGKPGENPIPLLTGMLATKRIEGKDTVGSKEE